MNNKGFIDVWAKCIIGLFFISLALVTLLYLSGYEAEENPAAPLITFAPKRPFIPKENVALNQSKWAGAGFGWVLTNECGKCEKACWSVKHDRGGTTCVGIAVNRNPLFFEEVLNNAFQNCKNMGILQPVGTKAPFGIKKDFCWHLRNFYWDNYVKKFKNCTWKALINLSDTAILQGLRQAVKIHQKAHNLKIDGIFGPQSEKHCSKALWNNEAFVTQRIKTLKSYRQFDRFGAGWVKRVVDMNKKL